MSNLLKHVTSAKVTYSSIGQSTLELNIADPNVQVLGHTFLNKAVAAVELIVEGKEVVEKSADSKQIEQLLADKKRLEAEVKQLQAVIDNSVNNLTELMNNTSSNKAIKEALADSFGIWGFRNGRY